MINKHSLLLLAIVIVGVILRIMLINAGITLDETVTVYVANSQDLAEVLHRIKLYEFGPPIYFILMYFWVHCFGDSIVALTIPSMVFGILLIPAVYLLARELFERHDLALLSALYASVSPLAVLYSREVRTYTLFALVVTVTYYLFIRCLKQTSAKRLLALGISTLVLIYTHYVAFFLVGMMVVTTLAYSRRISKPESFRMLPIQLTLLAALLCFLPYVPVLIEHQSVGTFWVDKVPATEFPFVFASSLAATMPLPFIAAFVLVCVGLPVFLSVTALDVLKRISKKQFSLNLDENGNYMFLIANLLIPLCQVGLVAPFIPGYSRYLMAFVVFGWILWAALSIDLLNWLSGKLRAQSWSPLVRRTVIAVLCALLIAGNGYEAMTLSVERSGLRQFAKDWQAGKFGNSALMIAPDFDSYTFIYYLDRESGGKPPEAYYTFPRQLTITPAQHRGYADSFRDPTLVDAALKWVESLDGNKYSSLVVVRDKDNIDSKLMPAATRVQELLDRIEERFKRENVQVYTGKNRTFEVIRFKLRT